MSCQTDDVAREMFALLQPLSRVDRLSTLIDLITRLQWDEESKDESTPVACPNCDTRFTP